MAGTQHRIKYVISAIARTAGIVMIVRQGVRMYIINTVLVA